MILCAVVIIFIILQWLPKLDFPKFDGSNPRLWVKQCETFFDVYAIAPRLWVRYASMNLIGSAALWFQTLQGNSTEITWDAFVLSATNRFDRDEHNHLLRQFFHHQQLSDVSEYVEQFSDIVHQLLLMIPPFHPLLLPTILLMALEKILEL